MKRNIVLILCCIFLSLIGIKNTQADVNYDVKDYTVNVDVQKNGSLSKRTDAKILIIIFKLLDESLIVFFVLSREENYIIL